MRRRLLGIIAGALIVGGIVGLQVGGGSSSQLGLFSSACVRAGVVLGALWLAFPRIIDLATRFPPWLLGATVLGGLAVAVRPRFGVLVLPLLTLLFLMHGMGLLFSPLKPKGRVKPDRKRSPQPAGDRPPNKPNRPN